MARAAVNHAAAPTEPTTYTMTAGFGDQGGEANYFAPQTIAIYQGDTITWKVGGDLEPHTIAFGPKALLDRLASGLISPIRQKAGPPVIALNAQAAFPIVGTTYAGTGFANSGILFGKGKSWSLTFTTPGTYHYNCLIHYDASFGGQKMGGTVVVSPRPVTGHLYNVSAGSMYDSMVNGSDTFSPARLTIHAGDSVVWHGFLHTVSFGPPALLAKLHQTLLLPIPQKTGRPVLAFNPQVALPSGGNTVSGPGFVNSGLLNPTGPHVPSWKASFPTPGTYTYVCLLHPHMTGTITVLPTGM
ncbi:MAG TPA: plastocyanin/azurin family copper-binding protein [Chloroflexota bacterium]|nr:plastocyanin/azurin family copper-binding protein [Chloroflexota bacterium]